MIADINQIFPAGKTSTTATGSLAETAFGYPRDFLGNRFVYTVVSPRAGGLSVGVNLNPDKQCDFNCVYCEVDRKVPSPQPNFDVRAMLTELGKTLTLVKDGRLRERPKYRTLPTELLQLRHVALSGDGEPTLSPHFAEALQEVLYLRALNSFGCFKLVVITNTSGLNRPSVLSALKHLVPTDEIWVELDGGTQAYITRINGTNTPVETILANILAVAKDRPVVIQSLFPTIDGQSEPPFEEIQCYARRLSALRKAGAQVSMVQIYSATRPTHGSQCGHLPLKVLSRIAQTVRQTGFKAEVF